ncbi:MAG TPA: RNA 2',3'-cyclic phosphodiesterase [Candidatus Thermoplasmatota archaeon]|nr:RNA 2',3'-cyclic phosphodiesterase [Candidatus Thermoplasmatota archaeon]
MPRPRAVPQMAGGLPALVARLFIGIPVLAPRLDEAVAGLRRVAPEARPVPAAKRHVTLRFLGECDPAAALGALQGALEGEDPLEGQVEGLGAFPDPRRARVAWAGLRAPGLSGLARRVRDATAALGRRGEPAFTPHVTLARLPGERDLTAWCAGVASDTPAPWGAFRATAVTLFESVPGAAAYRVLREVPLGLPLGEGAEGLA